MSEFDLIARYFARPTRHAVLGVGDDCALLAPTPGMQLAISADMLVEGRHFFADVDPCRLGHKALAVNLSDLAAMGAKPAWCTLSIALPSLNENWVAAFCTGFFALANAHGLELVGGDTTRGPLTIAVQIAGELPPGCAIRRDGAQVGDDIWVSGTLGAAAVAVMARTGRLDDAGLDALAGMQCVDRLDLPTPRIELGLALRGIATAALDISDGLLGDLAHICRRSSCGAQIIWPLLPVHPALVALPEAIRQEAALAGGDDYELCFTAAASRRNELQALSQQLCLPLTHIGVIDAATGVRAVDASGQPVLPGKTGFDHFAA
ncbi:Thiamine-monophosphate kinase [Andreprevotia sp. IGB-42]|uniref:thiamine-phosphate kinase n=1 Tax=Andreprevotia sp. IGB-42 TaxID=2497473 RepID=UPI00157F34F7|nr:thiamine-phosphate kinase [Andreprevotia sp. IGB-42]KAF0814154.1 Thiamine-monophosphate kinase [Andreprevotia sp. IGB-42]